MIGQARIGILWLELSCCLGVSDAAAWLLYNRILRHTTESKEIGHCIHARDHVDCCMVCIERGLRAEEVDG